MAAMLFVLSCGAVAAQELFVVQDVPVDVTAETAAEARDRAIDQATRTAFDRLSDRLSSEPGFGPPPPVSGAALQNLVEGIEFANEKSSSVRYLADITVRFRPDAVRNLYGGGAAGAYGDSSRDFERQRGMPAPIGQPSGPAVAGGPLLVVIPVYEMDQARVVWERFNPWWVAWNEGVGRGRGIRLRLPAGDAEDSGILTAEEAATGDRTSILTLADRYGADGALIARARLDRSGPSPAVDLVVTSFGDVSRSIGLVDTVRGTPGESVDELSRRAVARVVEMVEQAVGATPRTAVDQVPSVGNASMVVTAEVDSPQDLAAMRQNLRSAVAREELISLSRGEAKLRLFHSGDREALRSALSRSGFIVTDSSEGWSLSFPGPSGTPLTAPSPALSGGR